MTFISGDAVSACMCVSVAPTLRLPYRELRQAPESDALLTCIVDANPAGEAYWERDDGTRPSDMVQHSSSSADIDQPLPLMSADRTVSDFRSQTWTITRDGYTRVIGAFVENLDERDFGVYTCHARNEYGKTFAMISVLGEWSVQAVHQSAISTWAGPFICS
jgi:Immunoglobulin domain